MTDESLALEFGEHRQRLFDGSLRRSQNLADAQIDNVESIQAKVSEIVMGRIDEFLARQSLMPGLIGSAASAHFGDDRQTLRIRMERLPDDLIRYVGSVEIASVDVVYASFHRFAQNVLRGVKVARRSPHAATSQLHRAISHAVQGERRVC